MVNVIGSCSLLSMSGSRNQHKAIGTIKNVEDNGIAMIPISNQSHNMDIPIRIQRPRVIVKLLQKVTLLTPTPTMTKVITMMVMNLIAQ